MSTNIASLSKDLDCVRTQTAACRFFPTAGMFKCENLCLNCVFLGEKAGCLNVRVSDLNNIYQCMTQCGQDPNYLYTF